MSSTVLIIRLLFLFLAGCSSSWFILLVACRSVVVACIWFRLVVVLSILIWLIGVRCDIFVCDLVLWILVRVVDVVVSMVGLLFLVVWVIDISFLMVGHGVWCIELFIYYDYVFFVMKGMIGVSRCSCIESVMVSVVWVDVVAGEMVLLFDFVACLYARFLISSM